MRIIRYVNGKRVVKAFDSDTVIENGKILQAINQVNRRLLGTEEKSLPNRHGAENE